MRGLWIGLAAVVGIVVVGLGGYFLLYGIAESIKCEEVVVMQQTRVTRLWEYPVLLVCILLLVPALTAAMWDTERGMLRNFFR